MNRVGSLDMDVCICRDGSHRYRRFVQQNDSIGTDGSRSRIIAWVETDAQVQMDCAAE